jgi:hypothetical protein
MPSFVKSTLLGLGLTMSAIAMAQAQSVATLPPNGGAAPGAAPTMQSAVTQPYGSTQSFFPKPGGAEVFRDEAPYQQPGAYATTNTAVPAATSVPAAPYQATTDTDPSSQHPYSSRTTPKAN